MAMDGRQKRFIAARSFSLPAEAKEGTIIVSRFLLRKDDEYQPASRCRRRRRKGRRRFTAVIISACFQRSAGANGLRAAARSRIGRFFSFAQATQRILLPRNRSFCTVTVTGEQSALLYNLYPSPESLANFGSRLGLNIFLFYIIYTFYFQAACVKSCFLRFKSFYAWACAPSYT